MKYLSQLIEEKQTQLFEETGAFFAFSKKRFDEQKQEGVTYVSIGAGLLCPKSTVDLLIKGLNTISAEGVKEHFKLYGAKKIIHQVYFNYESHISMCTDEAKSALSKYADQYPEQFTDDIINAEFKACFKLAVENDWF